MYLSFFVSGYLLSVPLDPSYTCSSKVADISPGDIVHILDETEYRVLRVNPRSASIILKRVDPCYIGSYPSSSNQRSFMRPATSLCLLPSSTRDASVEGNEPADNCICDLTPPPVLPDVSDSSTQCNLPDVCAASTQCDFEADSYAAFKCSRFDSLDRLVQSFEEAKLSANAAFKNLVTKSTQEKNLEHRFQNSSNE